MKRILSLLLLLSIGTAHASGEVYLPNLKKNATGTTTGAKTGIDVYLSGGALGGTAATGSVFGATDVGQISLSVRNDAEAALTGVADGDVTPLQVDSVGRLKVNSAETATAADGGALPAVQKVIAGYDGSNVQVIKTDASGSIQVDVESSALPSGAATSANQSTAITSLGNIDTSTSGISAKFGSLGQKAMAGSAPVVISSDQSAIPSSQSGTWNINNISGTIALPTGAATSANQGTANTSLSSIDGKITACNTGAVTISGALPAGTASIGKVKTDPAVTGSGSAASATVSTVITLSAPANAIGFILMNLDTSTANLRWAVGRTATTALGQQLQPGRDTGFVPIGANVSLVAESGTQNYDVQWIAQ